MHFLELNNDVMVTNLVKILKHQETTVDDEQLRTRIKINRSKTVSTQSELSFVGDCITRVEIQSPLISKFFDSKTKLYVEASAERPIGVKSIGFDKWYGIQDSECFFLDSTFQTNTYGQLVTPLNYHICIQDEYVGFKLAGQQLVDTLAANKLPILVSEKLVVTHLSDLDSLLNVMDRNDSDYMLSSLFYAKKNAKQYLMQAGYFSVNASYIEHNLYKFVVKFMGVDGRYIELPNATVRFTDHELRAVDYDSGHMVTMNAKGQSFDRGVLSMAILDINMCSRFILDQLIGNSGESSQRVLANIEKMLY